MTLKKLYWMADGRRAQQWVHTAELLCKIHNVNCSKDKDLKSPDFFNLHEKAKQSQQATGRKMSFKEKIAGLKPRFIEG